MQDKVPLLYTHAGKKVWKDHIYESGLTFTHGEVTLVPGYLVSNFLRHPEFTDARVGKAKSFDINKTPPPKPKEKEEEPALVDLSAMTKDAISTYAKRNFNLELQPTMKKSDMVELVRRQMGTDMPVGY